MANMDWLQTTREHETVWVLPRPVPSAPPPHRSSRRLLIEFILALIVVSVLLIMLFRLLPDEGYGLRDLLLPRDCAAPCFMGVRPGVTTLEQAESILDEHAWVGEIWHNRRGAAVTQVMWTWTGEQPSSLINDGTPFMTSVNGVIQQIYLPTQVPYGEVWNWIGEPQHAGMFMSGHASVLSSDDTARSAVYTASYADGGIEVQTTTACPFTVDSFWNAPSLLLYTLPGQVRPDIAPVDAFDWLHNQPC